MNGLRTTQQPCPSPPPPAPPSDYFSEIPKQDYISAYQPPRSAAVEYTLSTTNTPLYDEQDYLEIDPGSYSFLSALSEAFVQQLGNQEIFTGEEAAHALHRVLAFAHYPEYQSILVANALMHCKPNVLFQPEEHYGNPPRKDVKFKPAWNQKYMLRRDALGEKTKPVGVLFTLTRCYAPTCEPGNQTCYSVRCPNRSNNALNEILPTGSTSSDVQLLLHDNDAESSIIVVPRQDSSSSSEELSHNEAARQRAIVELIRSHRSFCNILNILDEVIVSAIRTAEEIGPASRRSSLIANVFTNYEELRLISQSLLNEMQDRRRQYQQGYIPQIADILQRHLLRMSNPLVQYLSNIPLAEYIIKRERSTNKEFDHVLERTKHHEKIARSPITAIQYYYLAPRIQLPRYLSHLLGIRAHTPPSHPDYTLLRDCQDIIGWIERSCGKKSNNTQGRMEVLQLADLLLVKPNVDLKLMEPERRLLYQGKLRRSGQIRKKTIHIFVFDHLVLFTKRDDKLLGGKYEIWDRPIPLPMLYISESKTNCISEPPVSVTQRHNGFASLFHNPGGRLGQALVFEHLGRPSQKVREFSCELEEKKRCLAAIDAARSHENHKSDVFHIDVFSRSTFLTFRSTRDRGYDQVLCSVPLIGTEEDTILVSTDKGVYLMRRNEIIGKKLTLTRNGKVIKLAVMPKVRLLLALTDKHFLMAYTLESIMDSIRMSDGLDPPRCFCINDGVSLFQVGSTRQYKDLLIYKRHIPGHGDEIMGVRPKSELYNETTRQKFMLTSPPMFNGRRLQIARLFERVHLRNFEAKGVCRIQFCGDDNVALVCMNNFRFLSFDSQEPYESRSSAAIPNKRGRNEEVTEARTAFNLTPKQTLICCNRYCFLIDEERNPISSGGQRYLFKWESEPEQIVRYHDHVIGFSKHFIEFRSILSVRLFITWYLRRKRSAEGTLYYVGRACSIIFGGFMPFDF
ncbi:hypothetical protein BJV82DRAFT_271693 [Fennellomyces sp. T-0311]|nr:hypothetical protein BJV82DRAFT_271693 [Fennellomyces sp. T-0311]